MTAVVIAVLSGAGSLVLLLSVAGVLKMPTDSDRLHYLGPATTIAPIAIAAAIVVEEGFTSQAGLKACLIASVLLVTSPIVSYATLRALRTREAGAPAGPPDTPLQT